MKAVFLLSNSEPLPTGACSEADTFLLLLPVVFLSCLSVLFSYLLQAFESVLMIFEIKLAVDVFTAVVI